MQERIQDRVEQFLNEGANFEYFKCYETFSHSLFQKIKFSIRCLSEYPPISVAMRGKIDMRPKVKA